MEQKRAPPFEKTVAPLGHLNGKLRSRTDGAPAFYDDTISAFGFSLIERTVGLTKKVFEVRVSPGRPDMDTYTGRHRRIAGGALRNGYRLPQALRAFLCLLRPTANPAQEEFLSAITHGVDIPLSRKTADLFRDHTEAFVSGQMAVFVVVLFEEINIHHEPRYRQTASTHILQPLTDMPLQIPAVVEPRKLVGIRQFLQLLIHPLQFLILLLDQNISVVCGGP